MTSEFFQKLSAHFAGDVEGPNILLAYLFGSRVSGSVGPQSDYDFAVLFSDEPEAGRVSGLKHRISILLRTDRIDLVVLNRAPVELRYNVVASGRILYQRSRTVLIEFEAQTLSFYFDYLPVLRHHRREVLEERDYETGVQRYRTALGKTQELLAQIRTL